MDVIRMWKTNWIDSPDIPMIESYLKIMLEEINELSEKVKTLQKEKEDLERDRDYWMDQAHSWMNMYYDGDSDDN